MYEPSNDRIVAFGDVSATNRYTRGPERGCRTERD